MYSVSYSNFVDVVSCLIINMRTYKRKNVLNESIEPIEGVLGLCRLCLQDAKDSVPIFANKNDICALLATRIMMCVGYEITRDDCLPNAICIECHNELNRYYEFRKKCDSTYHKLKNHLLAVQATKKANELSVKQDEQKALVDNTSVCSISQSVCSISQSVCPISQSVCPISQSVCSISQSVCPISQSVCSISQSVCPISQSVCPISQSVCSISQSVCSVNQSDSTDVQTVYPVNQSVCAASQSNNHSESTDVQTVYPDCPVSRSVTSLVSHVVTMSRDQLILAFEKPLETVQAELHQNGFDNAVNGDTLIDVAVLNKGVEVKSQEPITIQTESMEVSLDVKEFLSAILFEMGALKMQQDEVQLTEECRTIQIETGDGELITLELVQMEEEEQTTTTNKKKKVKRKATNEVTKQQKDERPRCSECGRQFATRAVLRRHARTHTGERPFRCARCGLSFNQREVLTRHELVHRDVRPFACTRCPKSFTQRNALAAHARRHDAPEAGTVTLHHCSQCPKKFLHASGLSRHARSHAGRVASCAHCARRFVDDSSLRRHVRLKHEPHPPPKPRDMHYELLTPLLAPTSGS